MKSIAFLGEAFYTQELIRVSHAIPTQPAVPSKKHRLRFRYYDQDERELSLGPLTLQDIEIQGVDFSVTLDGDTNGDGKVDLVDLNNVRNNFGGAGLGDTNGDSIVDLEDLNAVRNNFGVGGANSVPEPGTLTLGSFGCVLLYA